MSNTSLLGSFGGQAGDALMFRNRIINGDMRIAQRGNVALSNNAILYGGCDRTFVVPVSFTTATGTALQSTFTGSTSGKGQFAALTTTGTGQVIFVQRIESQNVNDLNGQNVTFSGKIAHDIGTTQSVFLRITKANALDNFSTATTILQQTISVPSGVTTSFTMTALLGATDANNGLAVEVVFNLGAVSNKNMGVSDLQLEAGPTATPFERRPYGTELALAMRYYEQIPLRYFGGIYIASTNRFICTQPVFFKVTKRIAGSQYSIAAGSGTAYWADSNQIFSATSNTGFNFTGDEFSMQYFQIRQAGGTTPGDNKFVFLESYPSVAVNAEL